jgi:hypothetical protein
VTPAAVPRGQVAMSVRREPAAGAMTGEQLRRTCQRAVFAFLMAWTSSGGSAMVSDVGMSVASQRRGRRV